MATGVPFGTSEPIAFDPGQRCPAHGRSAFGDSKVWQICQANLREGWLKRAGDHRIEVW